MANLSDDERGQIILIAAFALAVTFVALALIVNSAIFTENLASRGETAGSDDALAMRSMVETNAGYTLGAANRYNYTSDSDRDEAIRLAINNTSMQTEQQQAMTGALVNVSYRPAASVNGKRIAQNSTASPKPTFESSTVSRTFETSTNFSVARGLSRPGDQNATRQFVINASDISSGNASSFEVEVRKDRIVELPGTNTETWQMHVFESPNVGNDSVHLRTIVNDGGSTRKTQCVVDPQRSYVTIDVTGGTVDGEPCQALGIRSDGANFHFGAGATDDYHIRFKHADQIRGNYSLVVRGSPGTSNLASGPAPGSAGPYWTDAYYSITVEYSYDTPNLRYVTDIRVAPGEPDA